MPKTDPHTGCPVMTLPEFAQAEGTTVGELLEDVYGEMDKEAVSREEALKNPRNLALEVRTIECNILWEVYTVDEVSCSFGLKESKFAATFFGKAPDGKVGTFKVSHAYWSGTMSEPPGEDWEIVCESDPTWEGDYDC